MKPLPGGAFPGSRPGGVSPRFLLPVVLGYGALVLILLLRHEMWQDEWQAWLIAQDSPSLPELFRNLRYEGHPGLWHLGLFLITRVTHNPLSMQLLHLLVAASAVYVFLRYSPFTRLQKILFILGYFPFYEYAVISRNYALAVLGLFWYCALFCRPGPRPYLLLGLILFFLGQTSVYGLMIAMVLGVILLGAALQERAAGTFKAIAGFALVLLGIGLAILQIIPPPDSGFAVGWHFDLDLPRLLSTLATVWQSYVPLPALTYHFWGTNIIADPPWQALLSAILLAFGILLFYRQPLPCLFYLLGTAGLLTFTYVKYPGSLRHHGHLYLLFIASLWLSSQGVQAPGPSPRLTPLPILGDFCRTHRDRLVTALLAAHLLAGLWAASLDLLYPFSASRAAARFIQEHQLDRLAIVGDADDAASSVAGCLNRRLYYPASRCQGSFIVWNRQRKTELEPEEVLAQAGALSRQRRQDVLLLLNYELPPGRFPVIPLEKFTGSLVPVENYYLYLLPGAQE
ncbi:MAG: hypothetical protein ACYDIC_01670 [Desulfobaccales bacterium]